MDGFVTATVAVVPSGFVTVPVTAVAFAGAPVESRIVTVNVAAFPGRTQPRSHSKLWETDMRKSAPWSP